MTTKVLESKCTAKRLTERTTQETLNYWKQIPHVMKYFRETENPTARLPQDFMQGFLEVGLDSVHTRENESDHLSSGAQLICSVLGLGIVHRIHLSFPAYAPA